MSLDIYLYKSKVQDFPDEEDWSDFKKENELYWANITHNLGKMAEEAGFYRALWRPEEIGITKAIDLFPYIEKGIKKMIDNPSYYEQFDSPNGWGLYKHFLPWLVKLREQLLKYPESYIYISR
jgi:hypothetical protein